VDGSLREAFDVSCALVCLNRRTELDAILQLVGVMPHHYVFVFKGTADSGTYQTARAVLQSRLGEGLWPLQQVTANKRNLREGDQVVFYAAGADDPDGGYFLASAEVAGSFFAVNPEASDRSDAGGGEERLKVPASSGVAPWGRPPRYPFAVRIRAGAWLPKPVPIRPLLTILDFIEREDKWGAYLQGGICRISREDFDRILAAGRDP
jgi:hypothetical protein